MTASPPRLDVLYEDNHLLVVNKPAGLAIMGGTGRQDSLNLRAKQYLKEKYRKPGQVFLGIVSRLDAAVSGAVLFARTSKAASRLSEQFRQRHVEKIYWAVVEGAVAAGPMECVDWLLKDERRQRMRVVPARQPGAREARLVYEPLRGLAFDAPRGSLDGMNLKRGRDAGKRSKGPVGTERGKPRGTLIEVRLETGRKHQIRVQLAERGHPIVGDRKYGSRIAFAAGIALHARRLVFVHPTRGEKIEVAAAVPASWSRLGVD